VNSGGTAQSAVVSGAVRCNARAAFCGAAQSGEVGFAASGGMAMNSGFDRFELSGITGPGNSGPAGGHFWGRSGTIPTRYFSFVWLPAALIAGLGAWMLLSGYASKPAEGEPVLLATAVIGPVPATDTATNGLSFDPATSEAIAPQQRAPVDRLKISSQSWRRGGLGSNALVTFTLRNGNDYAVGDIEISCAFARPDGSHLTDRARLIHDTVNMKSRKTFARMHIGFVNVNASAAKCTLVAANRI
jgi:hypothetical protein